jgi:uncharacterized membrane protein HdeD (DUF308 family)
MANDWKKDINKYMHYVSLGMVFIYIGLGVFIYFYKGINLPDQNIKFVFCLFFVCYGIFRGVRWLQKNKERKYYDNDDYQNI